MDLFLDTGTSENLIRLKVFKFFHSQTGQVDIGGSCGERIDLSQLAVIYIQGKSFKYSRTRSFNAEACFFSLDTMTAALHLKSVRLFLLLVAYNVGFVFTSFSLSFVTMLHWLWSI